MRIWHWRGFGIAPQHIGNCDEGESLESIIEGANRARHHCIGGAFEGGKCYLFSDEKARADWESRAQG